MIWLKQPNFFALGHHRTFNARISSSVLEPDIGTLGLAFLHLTVSLYILIQVPTVPRKRLNRAHDISMPNTIYPVNRFPVELSRG
jgi:hypothetical protein